MKKARAIVDIDACERLTKIPLFSFYGHDLGRGWAVVVGKGCSGQQGMSGRKKGAREGHLHRVIGEHRLGVLMRAEDEEWERSGEWWDWSVGRLRVER